MILDHYILNTTSRCHVAETLLSVAGCFIVRRKHAQQHCDAHAEGNSKNGALVHSNLTVEVRSCGCRMVFLRARFRTPMLTLASNLRFWSDLDVWDWSYEIRRLRAQVLTHAPCHHNITQGWTSEYIVTRACAYLPQHTARGDGAQRSYSK